MNKEEAIKNFMYDLNRFIDFYNEPERKELQPLISEWYNNEGVVKNKYNGLSKNVC